MYTHVCVCVYIYIYTHGALRQTTPSPDAVRRAVRPEHARRAALGDDPRSDYYHYYLYFYYMFIIFIIRIIISTNIVVSIIICIITTITGDDPVRPLQEGTGSVRFVSVPFFLFFENSSVRFGSVRTISFPGSTRFGLLFSDA